MDLDYVFYLLRRVISSSFICYGAMTIQKFLYIFLIHAAVALCSVALFFQRTASTACQGPCNGSSNGLLGD